MTKRFEFNDSDLEIGNNEVKIDDIETDRIIKKDKQRPRIKKKKVTKTKHKTKVKKEKQGRSIFNKIKLF